MTQPGGPYPFAVQTGPAAVAPTAAPAPAQGVDWAAVQEREAAAAPAPELAQEDPDEAYRAALREEIGVLDTLGTQAARGALDALLAPGALLGAGLHAAGEQVGSKAVERFGRDLGRASSGAAAAEVFGFLLGGGDLDRADRARRTIQAQEEARPTLATISRMAGATAFGIGLGAGGAGSKALTSIAANAAEGAGGGAQMAYEQDADAPLRDVLTSAAIGGLLGGGLGVAAEGVSAGVRKVGEKVARGDLDKVFGQVQQFADERMIKSAIGNDAKTMRILTDNGRDFERLSRVADKMRAADLPTNADEMLGAISRQADDAGEQLTRVATDLDAQGFKPNATELLGKLYDQANELRQSGVGRFHEIADTLERQLAPYREKLAIKQLDSMGNEVVVGYRDPTFTDLRRLKMDLGRSMSFGKRTPSVADDQLSEQYGIVARELDSVADAAGPEVGAAWRKANQDYSDWRVVKDGLEEEMQRRLKNRFISPSDYGTGLTGALMTMIATGGAAIPSVAAGAAMALGHRALRFAGSKMASGLANRLARTRFSVPLSKAGGAEAQTVLQQIGRTRQFIDDTANAAGQNPTVRETAQNAAREVAAESMAKAAGPFDPTAWAKSNPIAKVVHRSEILDQASRDLAYGTEQALALRAAIPAEIDIGRLNRLTADADGTAAIGGLQQAVSDLIASVPPTPAGSKAARGLRDAANELSRANVAESFAVGHRLAAQLDSLVVGATPDGKALAAVAEDNFGARAALALRDALSSDSFGAAGRNYRSLVANPDPSVEILTNPEALRQALLEAREPGQLSGAAERLAAQIRESYDAARALGATQQAGDLAEVGKKLGAWRQLALDAEDATTLDGRPMATLVDLLNEGQKPLDPQTEVLETVGKEVNKVVPLLRQAVRGGRLLPGVAAVGLLSRQKPQTREEQQRTYDTRATTLARAVSNPDPGEVRGGAGVASAMGTKLAKLLADMPKPTETIRGKQPLSADDLRRANAMWEATLEPLSIFQDFAAGTVDYTKAAYAWEQYPGLKQAAQAGVLDIITHDLDEKQRAGLPDPLLSQLDYLVGFDGKLQPNVDPGFSARMSALPVQEQEDQPRPGGMLELPGSEPTHTEKMARTL